MLVSFNIKKWYGCRERYQEKMRGMRGKSEKRDAREMVAQEGVWAADRMNMRKVSFTVTTYCKEITRSCVVFRQIQLCWYNKVKTYRQERSKAGK